MRFYNNLKAMPAVGHFSIASEVGNLIFISGVLPIDIAKGDLVESSIESQTKQVFLNAKNIFHELNLDLSKVVKTTCFLTNMDNFKAFNQIYQESFMDHMPARSCVAVKELPFSALVEVEFILAK